MRRNVLMIAYEFPPINTSGSWRPFHFAKHLPEFGYRPLIVTQNGFCYASHALDKQVLQELDPCCRITTVRPWRFSARAEVADSSSAASAGILGRLSGTVERVANGRALGALTVLAGLRFLRRHGFDLIWASGPPWAALRLGYRLSKLTGKPLVADMRDPWTYGVLWTRLGPAEREKAKLWEPRVLQQAQRIVYTSPLTAEIMRGSCGDSVAQRIVAITNGFSQLSENLESAGRGPRCCFCYLGKLEKGIRDPSILLEGFRMACRDKAFADTARLRLIGTMRGFDGELTAKLTGPVETQECVPYRESLRLMREADVLILLQTMHGKGDDVVGGKAYEYLAAGKPILGVVPERGGDAWLLGTTGAGRVTGIDDAQCIAEGLHHYWRLWKDNKLTGAPAHCDLSRFDRRTLTHDLANLFEEILAGK